MRFNRRRHQRVKVSIHIEWGMTPGCEFHGDRITSLSIGGCFIQTQQTIKPDEQIFLCLWDPLYGGSIIRGRVRYQFSVSSQHPPIGIGVEFVGLDGADARDIEHLLEFYNESLSLCS